MLSKISPAPLTAYLLPRTWILQSKFQISLNLYSPGKFFWLTLWESFWTQRKLFLFLAWKYFFSFYIPTLERKLGIGLETGKEGRESKGTWGNVLPFHCRKLLISRAVPVHSSVLQKTHQLCEFVSRFLLQSHCGSLKQSPHAWDEVSRCSPSLLPYTSATWRRRSPCIHCGDSSTAAREGPCLYSSYFPFIYLPYASLSPYKKS